METLKRAVEKDLGLAITEEALCQALYIVLRKYAKDVDQDEITYAIADTLRGIYFAVETKLLYNEMVSACK